MSPVEFRIPFEIPERFIGMIATGAARRMGATIRDTATGRILAHVQETGWLSRRIAEAWRQFPLGVANPVGLVMSGGQLVSSILTNVQLEQVKNMLAGLQMLTAASVAVSAVGVGVSVAGFTLVMQRLRQLESHLARAHQDVLATRLAAERTEVRLATRDWARTEALLRRAEEAWDRPDAQAVWQQLEGPLEEEHCYWRGLVGGRFGPSIFLDPRFSLEQAMAAYEAVVTLASTRLQALLLLDQMKVARDYAADVQSWHDRTMLSLSSVEVARVRVAHQAQASGLTEGDVRSRLLDTSRRFLDGVCEIQLHLADRPQLIQVLVDQGIPGREYLRQLRNCQDTPLLMLPVCE